MAKAKASTKLKAKPKPVKIKSKLRAALKRPGDRPRVKKQSPPPKTKAKKPIFIDLTSSSPPEKRPTTTPKRIAAPHRVRDHLATQPPEYYIQPNHIRDITPGTVVWLPSKTDIVQNAFVDPHLHVNAFDHPAVIMTSLGSRTLQESNKLGHRKLLFRVRTSQLPGAKVDITFKNSKGMKGKYSFCQLS
ncbi:hypothetical protein EYC84_005403 [Monilinia fructicola]|uniref:Uncharacterized protein n=1 Tax=Monilinia fructicola TaxID=38448 RepID=A0A5M9K083_MONFR|nr:hypothetical protein EYC84_005403 [Monilinia fructicola]